MPDILFEDPFDWFAHWFADAQAAAIDDPTAMALGTVSATGQPQVRIVLLKQHDRKGFVFYTNEESNKGQAIASCPRGALNFYWAPLNRQVRIEGPIEAVTPEEADDYFHSRPRESQIGAWASEQSRPLESRALLIERIAEVERRFADQPVTRPPHWGGFRVVPSRIEFWQAGDFRLHDRWLFTRADEGQRWSAERLFP